MVVNATERPVSNLSLAVSGDGLARTVTQLPMIGPLSIRKVGFRIRGPAPDAEGTVVGKLELCGKQLITIHDIPLELRVRSPEAAHQRTFVSDIDGSVQYYALRLATRRRRTIRRRRSSFLATEPRWKRWVRRPLTLPRAGCT